MTIYIFGNKLIDSDNLPLKLLPKLKKIFPKIHFIETDPNENFLPSKTGFLIIMDSVMGIDRVILFDDINDFFLKRRVSPHDYDLAFHLKLLDKLGMLGEVKIIGIPPLNDIGEVLIQVQKQIKILEKNKITTISL